jgi:hypothetical protein
VSGTGRQEVADIEDCYQLDVVRVPMGDLLARGLRLVGSRSPDG